MKHLMQWRGPMLVVGRPSESKFVLESVSRPGTRFERNIANVRRWAGPLPDDNDIAENDTAISRPDVELHSFVFCREDNATKQVELAVVSNIGEEFVTLSILGRRAKNLKTATYGPVYQRKGDGAIRTEKPTGPPSAQKRWERFVLEVKFEDTDDLVLVTGVDVLPSGKVRVQSYKQLKAVDSALKVRRY